MTRTKAVNVSAANFVWDATEWAEGYTGPDTAKHLTSFKLKVSKACFLKVWVVGNATAAVEYFTAGENNQVLVMVCLDATNNKDQDAGSAFDGSGHLGDIVAGTNW